VDPIPLGIGRSGKSNFPRLTGFFFAQIHPRPPLQKEDWGIFLNSEHSNGKQQKLWLGHQNKYAASCIELQIYSHRLQNKNRTKLKIIRMSSAIY
jgi:hypothetical protein